MLAVKEAGAELLIIPRNPTREVFHREAQALLENAVWLPLINFKIFYVFLISLITEPSVLKILLSIILNSRTLKNLIKNLIVIPKGIFVANLLKEKAVNHIHAHWSSTTSTLAYTVSQLTGIPWSFTAHSGMILWNNMLREKVRSADFVRVISENRRKDILKIVGFEYKDKVFALHMGVRVPPYDQTIPRALSYPVLNTIGCIASLNIIKGQRYLIEACHILKKQRFNFECLLIGEGGEKSNFRRLIQRLGLDDEVKLIGLVDHGRVIKMFDDHLVDVLVLPSITLPLEKRAEGIPVALMEAMAHGVPVISTYTGSIPELLKNEGGIMVSERDPEALGEAIKEVLTRQDLREKLIKRGFERVNLEFNVKLIARELIKCFSKTK